MSLNCIEIEEVISTFPKTGIIKNINQIDKDTIYLRLFDGLKDFIIIISIKENYNRIYISQKKNLSDNKSLRFSQFLNSSLPSGRIKNIYQYNYSRIIVFEINCNNEIKKLVCRLWSKAGNILLLNKDNEIIDCLHRYPNKGEWPKEFLNIESFKQNIDINKYKIRDEFKNQSINSAIEIYFENIFQNEEFIHKRKILESVLSNQIKILNYSLQKINENLSFDKENNYLKFGELLKSNIYKIKKGDKEIELNDYSINVKFNIKLSPSLTPMQNAAKYFEKNKKLKVGRIKWETEKNKVEIKIECLNGSLLKLRNAINLEDLKVLENEITKFNDIKKRTTEKKSDKIYGKKFKLSDGYLATISRSAKEANEILKQAKGNDYWFHIRDYPGSHVVVKQIKGCEISESAKKEAALLAFHFSKAKNDSDADVYFTQVKYLHRGKGGPDGLVFPTQEKNIKINNVKNDILKIFSRS